MTLPGICRVCGCTDVKACTVESQQTDGQIVITPCWWVNDDRDLCSACDDAGDVEPEPEPLLFDHLGRPIHLGGES